MEKANQIEANRRQIGIVRLFLFSAGVILLFTASAKFISSFGYSNILRMNDPLIGFQFRNLFRIAGCLEMAVSLVCFFSKQTWLPTILLTWLATNFLLYRLGLVWIGYKKPCPCLGNLTDALHISSQKADIAMMMVLVYLIAGSYSTLFWIWREKLKVQLTPQSSGPNDSAI